MKKIEKLYEIEQYDSKADQTYVLININLLIRKTNEIIERQGEIIDVLNQKQPEGELTAGDVFQLKRLEAFAEDYKELKESMDKPEKQEECIKDR
jgi:hypothetical protein